MKLLLLCLFALLPTVLGSHDLSSYSFSTSLHDAYQLHWNFDRERQTISFAVRVQTTGWVGFGLSPNGGMPGSDVVIGWVDDDGAAFLHDCYATANAQPAIDVSQDWELVSGEEEDGFTTLEFRRDWVTCDPEGTDRDIEANTARVIFSWNSNDPPNNVPTSVAYHGRNQRGAASVNLLGGIAERPPEPDDAESFFIGVNNIVIPGDQDTTYWCVAIRIPEAVTRERHYIYRYVPEIQENNTAFVHHILVYQCEGLTDVVDGQSAECQGNVGGDGLDECREGSILAGWAVGGDEFVFPEGVALPVSGDGYGLFAVIEMHYDNPHLTSGVYDSSGIRFFYTAIPPRFEAGQLQIGAGVNPTLLVPPEASNFIITAVCTSNCTTRFLPEDGITIFANFLHTHLVGHGLVFEHYRMTDECGGLERLQPIEQNLQYDFNFQQTTVLPTPITVLPGDILVLKCYYDTTGSRRGPRRDSVTVGGEGTREEMCFTFPLYYPAANLFGFCGSFTSLEAYGNFLLGLGLPIEQLAPFGPAFENNASAFFNSSESYKVENAFNSLDWNSERVQALQNATLGGRAYYYCGSDEENSLFGETDALPVAQCLYEAPDVCTSAGSAGGLKATTSLLLLLAGLLFCALLA